MKNITEQIKNNEIKNVYLLYGNEQQVVKIYRNRLLSALLGTDSLEELKQDLNFSMFRGNPLDMDALVSIASSYPFLAEKRVVLVENTKAFSKENEALIRCINNLPETTYMIFVEDEIKDKKGPFNAVKEKGYVCEINTQPQEFVERWVIRQVSESGKRISKAALDTLIMRTGLDMMRIKSELDKIIPYKGEEVDIKAEDVIALVSVDPEDQVFKMIDAIADGNSELAMHYYFDLLELKSSPAGIVVLIERQMRILYQVKELREKGFDDKSIGNMVKDAKDYYVKKYIRQAQKFTKQEIKECLNDCVDLTLQSRTGAISANLSVEYIIIKYSNSEARK